MVRQNASDFHHEQQLLLPAFLYSHRGLVTAGSISGFVEEKDVGPNPWGYEGCDIALVRFE
jgi:hypothetical protein